MSSDNPQTPPVELGIRRVVEPSPVDLASVEYIVSNASIAEAWAKVRSNKGAPGVDNISIEKFPKWGRPKWEIFKKQLLEGTYSPLPALRVEIPKESGGIRLLGIPSVIDRVLMQAIAKVLGQKFYRQGYSYQIDIDLEKFFDTVNHDVLMNRVARKVKNKGLLKLLGRFLRAGVVVNGRLQPTRIGKKRGQPLNLSVQP